MITKYQRWLKLTRALIKEGTLVVEHYPGKNNSLIDCDGWGRIMTVTGAIVYLSEVHLLVDYAQDYRKRRAFADFTEDEREIHKELQRKRKIAGVYRRL